MIYSTTQNVLSSLKEYLDYKLIHDYQATQTVTGNLHLRPDERLVNQSVYGSRFGQFSYLEDLEVLNSGGPVSGYRDFARARFISNDSTLGLTFSGQVKEICSYITTDADEKIAYEDKYLSLHDFQSDGARDPYTKYLPAIFLKNISSEDFPYCLGGATKSHWAIRCLSIMDAESRMAAVEDCMRGLFNDYFPLLGAANTPLNAFGELKDLSWDYETFLSSPPAKIAKIKKVTYTPINAMNKYNPELFCGIHDFQITLKN